MPVPLRLTSSTALCLGLAHFPFSALAQEEVFQPEDNQAEVTVLETVVLSAEKQLKQAPGVSTITSTDLQRQPPANDLSEIIRRMPGVNLTGTSASGQRGNQRQIDIRGMGPENTLILIDGKPVLSRNAVRMGRAGERDTRGDSNWVPAEMVERIEVLRGPAAARYGSGASGGVVNIITKRPEAMMGTIGLRFGFPEDSREGGTQRGNLMLGGPINDVLSFRVYGNYNKTKADDPDINADANVNPAQVPPAGREGVVNKDVGALLSWDVTPDQKLDFEFNFSRQGNIFNGDRQLAGVNDILEELANSGAETNRLYRRTLSVSHTGAFDFGDSFSYLQWENTRNNRNLEGLAGSSEGAINTGETGTITLDNITAKSEWNLPFAIAGRDQVLTLGAEFRGEYMDDPVSNRQALVPGVQIPGTDPQGERDPKTDQQTYGIYAESNFYWSEQFVVTPGLRADYNSNFGSNFSPSLNATYHVNDRWQLKAGVARAFKAPNLFQLNPNYVYYTMGNGCPADFPAQNGVGCYVVGNPDLKAETSVNTEVGVAYNDAASGVVAGLTYFHNNYKDRIASSRVPIANANPNNAGGWVLQWDNVPKAVVSGLEANFAMPFSDTVNFTTNATYMIESEDKSNGQPLSLVPDYTINASVDWQATDELNLMASVSWYGTIHAPTASATTGGALTNTESRRPYSIANLGVTYQVRENMVINGGITNLLDKRIYREGNANAAGANTFNEPGRAFYIGMNASF
ncbi:TonB-dependent siderophore receptor [Haematobacter massiliensis]|uniref:Outer membrane receptor protein n=1 Tax=Haematobacter massiliensis TaxID=195105 RepID=A0A086Y5T1_9RHOB|nr:FepA family TonB-dependent siderophore receptor [Haematobacter massiliensis]KFI29631.1 outer membrane receptor protein [Haematobacter massiliensis]OWJ72978.1 TonB-dependent siderophore receptor [Haematobacter massiliensis]OWJ88456.1 TonB-dependent siderophore receptor [Haematobacter massiliensis]QBJ25708.1 TonB-dependent siderophore receptor [Haematobacter massiliensis]